MKKYLVEKGFKDKENKNKEYFIGNSFPQGTPYVTEERINFLIDNGYIREAELNEYSIEEIVGYAVLDLGITINELNSENYTTEKITELIKLRLEENAEETKKALQKKLKKVKIEYSEDMSIEELTNLLNESNK